MKFEVVKKIQVLDWVYTAYEIEAENESEIEEMSNYEFYSKAEYIEIIHREYDDTRTGVEAIENITREDLI